MAIRQPNFIIRTASVYGTIIEDLNVEMRCNLGWPYFSRLIHLWLCVTNIIHVAGV